jgi:ribonucrease Y
MLTIILLGLLVAIVSGVLGFFISKKLSNANFDIHIEQAKAKANVIEAEAQLLLHKSNLKSQEILLDAKKEYENVKERVLREFREKNEKLNQKEQKFKQYQEAESQKLDLQSRLLANEKLKLKRGEKALEILKNEYKAKVAKMVRLLESVSGMTQEEAKELLLEKVEERSRLEISHIVRKYENEALASAKKRANYILAQATTRYAGEFANERLVNNITLESDELKGRIIGREGRNIKTLESLLGVDIIIDDTPNTIVVSSFNLYRRAIATKTLELLIEDGRIQPARIEEIYAKVCDEFEDEILSEGEDIVASMGISTMHPELIKLVGKLRYRASYGQNALAHTLEVAHLASIMAAEMGGDALLAKRAGLLHDIGKALTHDHEGSHVDLGVDICKRYGEDPVVINAIYAHHGYEEIQSVECGAVCAADVLSAARPGARREVLESFLKRVNMVEEIAFEHSGVKQAYAINAGRELRVIVNAELLGDDEAALLAQEIAKEIEQKVQYPGEIKVNVIRELRATAFAS